MIGVTEPRIFSPPLRDLNPDTSLGFACVEYAKKILGKNLYPWQEWALIHSLEIIGELDGEWRFRFRTVLFLISRQNGKTVLSEVVASFFLNVLGVGSIFGTSLSLDKAEEVWEAVINDQPYVGESLVVDRASKLVALVYLDAEAIKNAKLDGEAVSDIPERIRTATNRQLPNYSQIAKVETVLAPFEKTPKMSIKRFLYK